jgi:hypothetical protein
MIRNSKNRLYELETKLLRISREVASIEDELYENDDKYGTIRAKIQDAISDLMFSKFTLNRAYEIVNKARASRKAQEID